MRTATPGRGRPTLPGRVVGCASDAPFGHGSATALGMEWANKGWVMRMSEGGTWEEA